MKQHGAYEVKDKSTIDKLVKLVLNDNMKIKTEFVGKSAKYILSKIGIEVDDSIRVILMETELEHPFVQTELMMPILH